MRIRAFCVAVALVAALMPAMAAGTPSASAAPAPILSSRWASGPTGTVIWESQPRSDGFRHIDTPATIELLKTLGVNHFTYVIYQSRKDWDDLRLEFASAAQRAGIDIWVYLVPPSECDPTSEPPHRAGRCSYPYKLDFIAWAKAIASLSVEHPNVTGWAVDDFLTTTANRELFTKDYLAEVRAAQDAINPGLGIYAVLYYGQIRNDADLDLIADSLDGVIFPYLAHGTNTADPTLLEEQLDNAVAQVNPRGLELILLIYAGRHLGAIIHPTETYVAALLRRSKPYLLDGRVRGVMAYGTPMVLDRQEPSHENNARHGDGRLSLGVSSSTPTDAGGHAEASQTISVDQAAKEKRLTFYQRDQIETGRSPDFHITQVLIDGNVVSESDVGDDERDTWLRTDLDLTDALAGKSSATLTFRLLETQPVANYPIDIGIDDVRGAGISITNGGFEASGGWTLERNHHGVQPLLDTYVATRPAKIFNAIGSGYAEILGTTYRPVDEPDYSWLRPGPDNRSFYGNGSLTLRVPGGTAIPAGACASASQTVQVTPGLPRYELELWQTDSHLGKYPGYVVKEVLINGQLLRRSDVADRGWWHYLAGISPYGPIDITEFGKHSDTATVTVRVCLEQAIEPGVDLGVEGVEVRFDELGGSGLRLRNAGFEARDSWQLTAPRPLEASIDIAG